MAELKTKNGMKFLAFVLIGACLLYLTAADFSFSQTDSPESYLQDGKQLLGKGDFAQSLEKLAKAEVFLKSGLPGPGAEKLAEVYFYEAVNYSRQGREDMARELFQKALRTAPDKAFDTSVMDETTKKIFGEAKMALERENSPKAMGTAGTPQEGKHSNAVVWIVVGIVVVAAAAVAAYFLFFKKGEGDVEVDSDPQGAKVYLDGADTNKTTPCSLSALKEGEHTIKLTLADFGEWEGKVTVKKKEHASISPTLSGYQYQHITTYTTPVYIEASGGIDLDRSRNIYYTSQQLGGGYGHVHKFSSSGSYIEAKNTGRHESLHGLAIDTSGSQDYFITTDRFYWNKVFRFNWAGTSSIEWGGPVNGGSGNGQFNGPEAVTVDSSGNIYVADKSNHRIQKFNSSGGFLAAWGGYGSGNGQFNNPEGIAVDSSNNVYVADTGNNRVQKFTSSGAFVKTWGTAGSGNGQFNGPHAIDVNPNGGVFVMDRSNVRVQKFTTNGGYLTQFGVGGTDLVADELGNVFILSLGNISKWSITSLISADAATQLKSLSLTGNIKDSFRLFIPAPSGRTENSTLNSTVQLEQKARLKDKKQ
jgi:tetratricopeptide (TPR) repeat protein/sugar lactone lactonase YvrE